MADFNSVTAHKPRVPETIWIVSAEWLAGYDRRKIRLDNIYFSETAALAHWDGLTPENHNRAYKYPDGFDAGFVRHPIRRFDETTIRQPNEGVR